MPNIVLTRIDNRLVHGQVATQWCGAIGANLILVANDEVAGNSLRQGLMNMAAPSYASMRYWTIQKTIDTIHKASAKQLIFIVCENPQDVRWQVPLQLTIPMWLLSSGCRNSVWNWRFVVFLPNMRKAPTSCSSKQTAALLNT